MIISRRDAIPTGTRWRAVMGAVTQEACRNDCPDSAAARLSTPPPPASAWPNACQRPLRAAFPAPLPVNADVSARHRRRLRSHPAPICGPERQAPEMELIFCCYRKLAVKVHTRPRQAERHARFSDLDKLPRISTVSDAVRLANPRASEEDGSASAPSPDMLGLHPRALRPLRRLLPHT